MNPFRTILVHVDTNAERQEGLELAARLAKEHGSELLAVDICPDLSWAAKLLVSRHESMLRDIEAGKLQRLTDLLAPYQADGISATTTVLHGRTSIEMIRQAIRNEADLVIKTSKGRHSRQSGFFGTTAQRLLRKCPCPVLIVPADGIDFSRVAAAVEPTPVDETHRELNLRIVKYADFLAAPNQSDVISAWEIYGESLLKEHMREEEFASLTLDAEQHARENLESLMRLAHREFDDHAKLLHGDPGDVIAKHVEQEDVGLLVMGTIGRSGVAGLMMGNTAERVLAKVECSVLAVKPAGFVSVVKV